MSRTSAGSHRQWYFHALRHRSRAEVFDHRPTLPQGKRKAAETPMMEISAAKVGGDEKGGKTGLQGRENPTGSRRCPIGRKSAQQPDTQQMSRTWHSTRKIVGRREKRQMGFSRIPFAPFQPPPEGCHLYRYPSGQSAKCLPSDDLLLCIWAKFSARKSSHNWRPMGLPSFLKTR